MGDGALCYGTLEIVGLLLLFYYYYPTRLELRLTFGTIRHSINSNIPLGQASHYVVCRY